jgi:Uma2 family endonuclease
MTTDEYLRTPETVLPQELVYGVVRDAAAPAPGHQSAVTAFLITLVMHVEPRGLGRVWPSPIDVVLDCEQHLVVQPDLIFVRSERLHIVTDRVWGAPDLVVEVLSPRPRIGRLDERLEWFARYGVRECWLYHQPERYLEVLEFADGGTADRRLLPAGAPIRSTVLRDFDLSIERILGEQ